MKKKHTKKVNEITGTITRGALSLVFYVFVITLVISAVKGGYQFGYDIFNGEPLSANSQHVVRYKVEEEASIRDIAADLEKLGLIEDSTIMIIQKVFYGFNILPGTYELSPSMTSKEMLDWMTLLSHSVEEETEEETKAPAKKESKSETKEGGAA